MSIENIVNNEDDVDIDSYLIYYNFHNEQRPWKSVYFISYHIMPLHIILVYHCCHRCASVVVIPLIP